MKKLVKGFASVILASMIFVVGCKPPTSTSDPSTGGSEQTGQNKITVTVKGDERIESEQAFKIPSGSAWSSIKAEIKTKIKASADWKDDWNKGDYAVYEWRLGDENGDKISDTRTFTENATVYAVSNYTKWKIDNYKKLVGYEGSKPRGKIIVPDVVTSIGAYAFQGCSALTGITIPASVTSIGTDAFSDCLSLTGITIPVGVTSIGSFAFYGCSALTGITIPDSVTSIEDCAFAGCSALTGITIPDSVTSIGPCTFSKCSALTDITIPASVSTIGKGAFGNCKNLTLLSVDLGNAVYKSENNIIYTKDGKNLIAVASGLTGTIAIPDGVTTIGEDAFFYCSAFTGITIPSSVSTIGTGAFFGCSALTAIAIPASVSTIGLYAFMECNKLTSLSFADPKGWAVYQDSNYTTGKIDIAESGLKNKSTAAELLRETANNYYWKKN